MATTPTGKFWNVKNPKKPVGELDVEGKYDIPYNWTDWLDEIGQTIQSFVIYPDTPLKVVSSSIVTGSKIVLVRIAVDPLLYVAANHFGQTFGARCHIVATDGQEEDQTLWYKLVSK